MRKTFSSIRFRLILLALITVAPALGVVLYAGDEQHDRAGRAAQEEAMHLVRLAASNHAQLLETTRQLLVVMSHFPAVREQDRQPCSALLADMLALHPIYTNFLAFTPDGDIFCSAVPLKLPFNFAYRDWFQRVVQGRDSLVSGYNFVSTSEKALVSVAYPVREASGQLLAVVSAGFDLEWTSYIASEAALPPGSVLMVTKNPTGTVLVHNLEPEKWVGEPLPVGSLQQAIASQPEGTLQTAEMDGVERLYAFTSLPGASTGERIIITVGIPAEFAFAETRRALARNLTLLGAVTLLVLGTAWVGGNFSFLRRLEALRRAARQLGSGNLGARSGLAHESGEMGDLARAFDEMAARLEQGMRERRLAEALLQERNAALVQSQQKLALHLHQTLLGMIEWDVDFRVVQWNPAAERIFGYTEAEVLGRRATELIVPPALRAKIEAIFQRQLEQRGGGHGVNENLRKDGRTILCEWYNTPLVTAEGQVIGVASLVQDISEKQRAEQLQRRRAEELAVLQAVAAACVEIDAEDSLIERVTQLIGENLFPDNFGLLLYDECAGLLRPHHSYRIPDFVENLDIPLGQGITGWVAVHGQPRRVDDTSRETDYLLVDPAVRSELCVPLKVGERLLGVINAESTRPEAFSGDDERVMMALAGQLATAIARLRAVAELQRLAMVDELTGLYNRRFFFEFADHELKRARRYGSPTCIAMLDIDHFKRVNDRYGHPFGDRVLHAIAGCCRQKLREEDLIGRYGGEEFVILLPATDLAGAVLVAERLREAVAGLPLAEEVPDLRVTISLGVAQASSETLELGALLARADQALYAAKQAGRDCVATAP